MLQLNIPKTRIRGIKMKKAINDLKSFVTVWLMFLLGVIIIANLAGLHLDDPILLLFTNTLTAVITYYFTKKEDKDVEK